MSIEDRILDKKITTRLFGKKQTVSYREFCKITGMPEEILLWRLKKGYSPSRLLVKPTHILLYDGKKCSAKMLSERFGVATSTLVNRWEKGLRGRKLVAKEEVNNQSNDPERLRKLAIKECRKHLIALCRAHPEMIAHAKKYAVDGHLDPFNEAQARRNAQRLEARGHEVRQQGMELVA